MPVNGFVFRQQAVRSRSERTTLIAERRHYFDRAARVAGAASFTRVLGPATFVGGISSLTKPRSPHECFTHLRPPCAPFHALRSLCHPRLSDGDLAADWDDWLRQRQRA